MSGYRRWLIAIANFRIARRSGAIQCWINYFSHMQFLDF